MIEGVAKVLGLAVLCGITVLLVGLLGTGTTLSTLRTLTACRTLLIAFGLLNEHTVRELVLTGLRVNLQQLHLDVVAFLDACLFVMPSNRYHMISRVSQQQNHDAETRLRAWGYKLERLHGEIQCEALVDAAY